MLITCTECGKQVSENALSCPNCGNVKLGKRSSALKRSMPAKIICDISCVISVFIMFGFIIPLVWSFAFSIYSKNANKRVIDTEWYKKQSKESLISFIIILVIQVVIFGIIYYFLR